MSKKCSKCLNLYELNQFYKDKSNKTGYHSQCKLCKNLKQKENKLKISNENKIPINEKKCSKCNIIKKSLYFNRCCSNKDGLSIYCKSCNSLIRKKQKENKQKVNVNIDNSQYKKCVKCNLLKTKDNFRVNLKSNDKLYYICIHCQPKNNWTKEKQRISDKKYRNNNKEKMKEKYKQQSKNINRRIRDSLNHRINELLKSHKINKNNNTLKYVGCDIYFLKMWFEYLFLDGMNWDNYGEWHIDHVMPCSSFNLTNTDEIYKCFNWKNIQPLWKNDNLIKSNKIDIELIETHKKKTIIFEKNFISAQVKEGELLGPP